MSARQVVYLAQRLVGDLVIELQLVAGLGHARTGDRSEIVIPPVDPLARLAVVGRPAEVGGIDVGRQTLLEAVKLVGADKVHLPRQGGLIAGPPQMMGKGGHVRRKLGGIVVDAGG